MKRRDPCVNTFGAWELRIKRGTDACNIMGYRKVAAPVGCIAI